MGRPREKISLAFFSGREKAVYEQLSDEQILDNVFTMVHVLSSGFLN
jgi:hypothetical protein